MIKYFFFSQLNIVNIILFTVVLLLLHVELSAFFWESSGTRGRVQSTRASQVTHCRGASTGPGDREILRYFNDLGDPWRLAKIPANCQFPEHGDLLGFLQKITTPQTPNTITPLNPPLCKTFQSFQAFHIGAAIRVFSYPK